MSKLMRSALLVVALAIPACAGQAGMDEPSGSHMYDHFQRASQIQTAIIEARLERARGPATWMAEHERGEDLPAGSVSYIADMRSLASEVANAASLAEAAAIAARMARTCGACHANFDGGPDIEVTGGPPMQEGMAGRMILHVWGADRLWEGLIGPSEQAWSAGVSAMQDAMLVPADLTDAGEPTEMVRTLAREVRTLSAEAARTSDWDARSAIYGQFLAACGRCHELVGLDF